MLAYGPRPIVTSRSLVQSSKRAISSRFTAAARIGLRPAPESRSRGAFDAREIIAIFKTTHP